MKKILALLVVFASLVMGATAAAIPAWLEALGPGNQVVYGDYSTYKGVVENSFVNNPLSSELKFDTDGVHADIYQKVSTAITGDQIGIDRQFLTQSACAYAIQSPKLTPCTYDAENVNKATPLVIGIVKEQSAAFSGRLVADEEYHAGTQGYYDPGWYQGKPGCEYHWHPGTPGYTTYTDPSFTATFQDSACLQADGKVVKEALGMAGNNQPSVTVAVNDLLPGGSHDGMLTEVNAGISSSVQLTQKQVADVDGIRTSNYLSGSASMNGGFDNAILDGDELVKISFNTPSTDGFKFWWENVNPQ